MRTVNRSKDKALTQPELFQQSGVIAKTTGQRALAELLEAGKIKLLAPSHGEAQGIAEAKRRTWRGKMNVANGPDAALAKEVSC